MTYNIIHPPEYKWKMTNGQTTMHKTRHRVRGDKLYYTRDHPKLGTATLHKGSPQTRNCNITQGITPNSELQHYTRDHPKLGTATLTITQSKRSKNTCYMTSDNVFSDWLTPLVTLFDKTIYSTRKKSRELNITFQRSSRHLKIEMVFPNYLKSSSQSSSG